MQGKITNQIRIPCALGNSFFRYWIEFFRPLHHLTNRQMDVAACLLKRRYQLSKVIKDNDLLDKNVINDDGIAQVCQECQLTGQHLQVILGKLKECKVIINNRLNPKLIPNIDENLNFVCLAITFDWNDLQRNNQ